MKTVLVFLFLVMTTGCVILGSGAWQSDAALDKYRQQGCIDVVSSDGRYTGLAEIPNTNDWRTVTLTNMGIRISLPAGVGASDSDKWVAVPLYKIHGHYRDSRWAADVEVRKQTVFEREQEISQLDRIIRESWGENDPRSIETKWDELRFHPETEQRGGIYRRDIKCPDGSFLHIRGKAHGLKNRHTGENLYPQMEFVIRRIMDSIEPMR